jgi:hypothetical protein
MPPFYAMLATLQRHVAAMENGQYYSAVGAPLEDPEDAVVQRLLRDYRLVQYDLSVGERYALSRMFPQ